LLPDWGGQLQRFFWIDKEESGSSRFFFGKSKKIVGVFHPYLEAIIYYFKVTKTRPHEMAVNSQPHKPMPLSDSSAAKKMALIIDLFNGFI
jgi:hypothetical protein